MLYRVLVKCGMRKVKCGIDGAKICCGMVCKVRNASLACILRVFLHRERVCSQGCQGSSVHSLDYCNEENKLNLFATHPVAATGCLN